MDHKEATTTFRNAVKAAGIKAGIRKMNICGGRQIQLFTKQHGVEFTADQIETFTTIARDMGFTFVRRMEIDPTFCRQLTGLEQWEFHVH